MLTRVDVYTANGQTLSLPLQDVSGGYWIKDIEGLDPVKATIVSSQFAQLDGTEYQNARRESRNVVFKIGINSDYIDTTVSALRKQLYNFFMPKMVVLMKFYMDDVHFVDILGKVEDLPTPLFAKDPEANVSVICFDPDFVAPDSVVFNGASTTGTTEQALTYDGTVDSGFIFRLSVTQAITEFLLSNRVPSGDVYQMEFVGPLSIGDVVEISTVPKKKYARLTRAGVQSSVLYGVSPAASWFGLGPGVNNIRLQAAGTAMPFTIEYSPRYGGL